MKKKILIISLFFCLFLVACGETETQNEKTKIIEIYNEAVENGFTGTYEEWLSSIKGEKGDKGDPGDKGEQGDKGDNAISPIIRINTETNIWEVSYDNGTTWTSLEISATGEKGETGENGITPAFRINSKNNMWEISYDSGTTWFSLNVNAAGIKGEDGITPKLQINSNTNIWEVSYDNGATWTSLGISATGSKGEDGITYVPVIFNNYDGTKLYEFYFAYGTDAVYAGPTPTRESEIINETKTDYTFKQWDKPLTNITEPTIFTATYNKTSYTVYKVTFLDNNDELLYENYYKKGQNVIYPYDQPFSYDDTNVYQFAGWSSSLLNLSSSLTVKAIMVTIPRTMAGEYPQSLVTDETLITVLNSIQETDSNGYKSYNNEKYLAYSSSEYIDNNGNTVSSGIHYYKVEPIQWRWLQSSSNSIFVVSNYILDYQIYNEYYSGTKQRDGYDLSTSIVYSNNYAYSNIREWLNTTFKNKAFTSSALISTSSVYNDSNNAENPYRSATTQDKIFLLSTGQITAPSFFDSTNPLDLVPKITEYARAILSTMGAEAESLNNTYMTRSASETSSTQIYCVSKNGVVSSNYSIGTMMGVRPALSFTDIFGE